MRRAGARTCPDPVHAAQADSSRRPCLRPPAPAPFAEKSRGSSATLSALGETRVSPPQSRLQATARTMYPWAPLSVPLNFPHLLGGAPGAPVCHSPLCLLSSCHVFCCQIGPLGPFQFCFGRWGWAGFLLPRALDLPAWEWWTPSALPGAPSSSRGFPRGQGFCPPRPDCCSPG